MVMVGPALNLTGASFSIIHLNVPFFLSGGVAPGDAEKVRDMDIPQLYAVDLNSRFEIRPGLKNTEELAHFISKIRT